MTMKWTCEKCHSSGYVAYASSMGLSVGWDIKSDHSAKNPRCPFSVEDINVQVDERLNGSLIDGPRLRDASPEIRLAVHIFNRYAPDDVVQLELTSKQETIVWRSTAEDIMRVDYQQRLRKYEDMGFKITSMTKHFTKR